MGGAQNAAIGKERKTIRGGGANRLATPRIANGNF